MGFWDRAIDEIPNQQILSFNERSMSWQFAMVYVPRKIIAAPDSTSRVASFELFFDDDIDIFAAVRVDIEPDDTETCIIAVFLSKSFKKIKK